MKSEHEVAATHVVPLVKQPRRKVSQSVVEFEDLSEQTLGLHALFSHVHLPMPSVMVEAAKQID